MQEDILKKYEQLNDKWRVQNLSMEEQEEIEEFLEINIENEEVNKEKIEWFIGMYMNVKDKLYIEVAGLKVMSRNLRVDSEGWRIKDITWIVLWVEQKMKIKENKEWDIWECIDSEFEWEQFFTQDAANREVERLWLKLIEFEEWQKIIKECWWKTNEEESNKIINKLKLKLCGNFDFSNNALHNIDNATYYWLSQKPKGQYIIILGIMHKMCC